MSARAEMETESEVEQIQPIPIDDQLELMELIGNSGLTPDTSDNIAKVIAKLRELHEIFASRRNGHSASTNNKGPQKSLVSEEV